MTNNVSAQTTPPASNVLNRPGPAGGTATPSSSGLLPGRPTPGAAPSGAPITPAPATTNPQGNIDLSVTTSDIRINPVAPRAGQMAFTTLIHNLGGANAQATVVFNLLENGVQVSASQSMAFNVAGHGTFQANWSALIHAGKQYQVVVTVNAPGDTNLANNRAALAFTSAPR